MGREGEKRGRREEEGRKGIGGSGREREGEGGGGRGREREGEGEGGRGREREGEGGRGREREPPFKYQEIVNKCFVHTFCTCMSPANTVHECH